MTATTGRKISELALDTPDEADYVPGVDADTGVTKRFLMSLIRKVRVMTGSTTYGPRAAVRFIAGASATVNVVDNADNDSLDVTIDTTLGVSSIAHKYYLFATFR